MTTKPLDLDATECPHGTRDRMGCADCIVVVAHNAPDALIAAVQRIRAALADRDATIARVRALADYWEAMAERYRPSIEASGTGSPTADALLGAAVSVRAVLDGGAS